MLYSRTQKEKKVNIAALCFSLMSNRVDLSSLNYQLIFPLFISHGPVVVNVFLLWEKSKITNENRLRVTIEVSRLLSVIIALIIQS